MLGEWELISPELEDELGQGVNGTAKKYVGTLGDWEIVSPESYVKTRSYTRESSKEGVGITTRHWVSQTSRAVCKSRTCRAKFSLINSPKNCYKCGEVFCKQCLKQSRKLNAFANYDPQGKFYKVCSQCFDSDEQSVGASRSLMREFRVLRSTSRKTNSGPCGDVQKTVEARIVNGFLEEINSTHSLVRMVQSLTITLVKGAWKSQLNLCNVTTCSACLKKFERLFRARHQCTLCGAAVCDSCSNRDLIVYIPDEVRCKDEGQYAYAKLGLIRIQGGPTTEPEIHEYLRICGVCCKSRETKQLQDVVDSKRSQAHDVFWDSLTPFHTEMLSDQRLIEQSLEKYEVLVRSLEDGSEKHGFGSNVQVLSKAQIDLSDLFYNYVKHTSKMKSFKPITINTETLIKNMKRSTSRFYTENRALFVELKTNLEEYLPSKVIETVQNQVNKKALICVHLLVKQMAFEVLSAADKHEVAKAVDIAQHLAEAEDVIGEELKAVLYKLEGEGMSWEDHIKDVNAMIRVSLQDHRLIKLTTWQLSHPDYLLNELVERSCVILEQITVQLTVKTTQNSYKLVKDRINVLKSEILNLACMTVS